MIVNRTLFQFAPLLLCCITFIAYSATVYKTVDEEGNVVYSDQAPSSENLLVEQINLPEYPEQTDPKNQRFDQIRQTADRLKQDRLAREELKISQQQARQAASIYPQILVEENHYYHHPRHLRRFRDFPSIYNPHNNQRQPPDFIRRNPNNDSNKGGLIIPKSKLLTP